MISKNTRHVLTYDEVIEVFVSFGKLDGAAHEPFTAATVAFQDGDCLQGPSIGHVLHRMSEIGDALFNGTQSHRITNDGGMSTHLLHSVSKFRTSPSIISDSCIHCVTTSSCTPGRSKTSSIPSRSMRSCTACGRRHSVGVRYSSWIPTPRTSSPHSRPSKIHPLASEKHCPTEGTGRVCQKRPSSRERSTLTEARLCHRLHRAANR